MGWGWQRWQRWVVTNEHRGRRATSLARWGTRRVRLKLRTLRTEHGRIRANTVLSQGRPRLVGWDWRPRSRARTWERVVGRRGAPSAPLTGTGPLRAGVGYVWGYTSVWLQPVLALVPNWCVGRRRHGPLFWALGRKYRGARFKWRRAKRLLRLDSGFVIRCVRVFLFWVWYCIFVIVLCLFV